MAMRIVDCKTTPRPLRLMRERGVEPVSITPQIRRSGFADQISHRLRTSLKLDLERKTIHQKLLDAEVSLSEAYANFAKRVHPKGTIEMYFHHYSHQGQPMLRVVLHAPVTEETPISKKEIIERIARKQRLASTNAQQVKGLENLPPAIKANLEKLKAEHTAGRGLDFIAKMTHLAELYLHQGKKQTTMHLVYKL